MIASIFLCLVAKFNILKQVSAFSYWEHTIVFKFRGHTLLYSISGSNMFLSTSLPPTPDRDRFDLCVTVICITDGLMKVRPTQY
jgi:hypothetical protein